MVNSGVMTQAFTDAAGFSGQEFTTFVLCLIAVFVCMWGIVMVMGWLKLARSQLEPVSFLFNRLVLLAFLLVMVCVLIGS